MSDFVKNLKKIAPLPPVEEPIEEAAPKEKEAEDRKPAFSRV